MLSVPRRQLGWYEVLRRVRGAVRQTREQHRRAYQGAVGRALEEIYTGRIDEVAELLEFHFGHSDDAEKAIDYAKLAAEKSQHSWANSEARTYFNDALHRLDAMPDTKPNRLRRVDAVPKQAEVKYALGRYTEQNPGLGRNSQSRRRGRRPASRNVALLARFLAQHVGWAAGGRTLPQGSADCVDFRSGRAQCICGVRPHSGLHGGRQAARRHRGRRTCPFKLRVARQLLDGRPDPLTYDLCRELPRRPGG